MWPQRPDGARVYWCRQPGGGCGKGGDLIQFRRAFLGEDFKTAAAACGREVTARRHGSALRPPPERRRMSAFEPREYPAPDEAWRAQAAKLVDRAHAALMSTAGARARAGLARRGIDAATAERFRLGWLSEAVFRPRASWGLLPVMKDGREKRLWVPAGIVIPLVLGGEVWRVRVRRDGVEHGGLRYVQVEGSSCRTLVTDGDPRAAVVVESELDAMCVASSAGGLAAAVSTGSVSIRPDLPAHRMLCGCLRILVALDADKPGAEGSAWWEATYPSARRWPAPEGKDPGEAAAAGCDLRAWVRTGLPPAMTMGPTVSCCHDGGGAVCAGGPGRGEAAAPAADGGGSGAPRERVAGERAGARGKACGGGEVAPEPISGVLPAVTGVLALAQLMAGAPVKIRVTATELATLRPEAWARKNWGLACAISELVFFDRAVRTYLCGLPAGEYAATDLVRLERSAGGGREAVLRPGGGAVRAEGGA
jgi:hypothetical protein